MPRVVPPGTILGKATRGCIGADVVVATGDHPASVLGVIFSANRPDISKGVVTPAVTDNSLSNDNPAAAVTENSLSNDIPAAAVTVPRTPSGQSHSAVLNIGTSAQISFVLNGHTSNGKHPGGAEIRPYFESRQICLSAGVN